MTRIRCYNCQRFSYKVAVCHSQKSICSRFAGNHEVKKCPTNISGTENDTPRCANCDGAHPTSYGGCPAYKKAKEIVIIQTTEKLSYAQAVGVHKAKNASENKNAKKPQTPAPSNAVGKTQTPTPPNDESKDRPSRETATPNQEGSTNNPTGITEVSHSNCISKHYLVDFINAIASILKENKPKDVLIETLFKLCQNLNSKIQTKRSSWRNYCEKSKTRTKMSEVWRTAKRMNGVNSAHNIPNLKLGDQTFGANLQKAEIFATVFSKVSSETNTTSPEFSLRSRVRIY